MEVSVEGLTFRYRPDLEPVLKNVSETFSTGSFTTLTGPSGSGKSTFLYILGLLLRPTQGSLVWAGQTVTNLHDGQLSQLRAARAGFIFQDALLNPARTVLDNVCEPGIFAGIARRELHMRARELLEEFGIAHRADHRPGEVSGGQAQRVGLCRALITEPSIIFGDEPTGNLDHETALVVWNALQRAANSGATVIVATHDEALANQADRRVVLT